MKKILGFMFLLFILIIPNSVEAKKGDTAYLNLTDAITLYDSKNMSGTFPIATLNGKRILCIDMGKNLRSETYTNTGVQASSYQKKGINFLYNYMNADVYYQVAAQMTAWHRGSTGELKYAFMQSTVAGRKIPEQMATYMVGEIMPKLNATSESGNFCIWEPATAGNQRVIAPCDAGSTTGDGEGEIPTTCNPNVQIGSCGSASSFVDPTSWSCIAGNAKYKDNSTNQNKYCEIYCQEQVYTSFPGNNFTFSAGQYFTVGNNYWNNSKMWGPVSVNGTRTCKMYYKDGSKYQTGVNYAGWLADFKRIDNQVKEAYNAWQKENARVNNVKYKNRVGSCQSGTTTNKVFVAYGSCPKGQTLGGDGKCYLRSTYTGKATCPAGTTLEGMKCFRTEEVPVYNKAKYANVYVFDGSTIQDTNAYCEGESAPGYNASYEQNYNSLVSQRNSLIAMLNNCSTMNTPYTLKPNVSLNYGSDNQYSFNGNLTMDAGANDSAPPVSTPKTGADCSNGNCNIYQYNCSGNFRSCTNSKTYVRTIYNVSVSDKTTTTTKVVGYRLPEGGYRYTDKNTGTVYKTLPSDLASNNNYIDLKESVLPISIQRVTGSYDIGLNINNVGNINQGQAHFDKYSPFSGAYSCKYSVKNEVLLPPTIPDNKPHGLSVIYRPISLTTPFPGENGKGRNTGSNWCSGNDCSGTNSVVNSVILNNRNVKSDDVYKLDPIYSITLTPSVIKEIRKYNKTTNYSDFNLTCENGGTGNRCRSNFVQSRQYGFSGKCVGVSQNAFYTCANK